MMNMIEKKFVNKDLETELTSYIDDKQNVSFRGKDIAQILDYSNTRKVVWDHVDNEDKQLICCRTQNGAPTKHPKCCGGGGGVKRPHNKMTPEGNIIHSLMSLAFTLLFYPQN